MINKKMGEKKFHKVLKLDVTATVRTLAVGEEVTIDCAEYAPYLSIFSVVSRENKKAREAGLEDMFAIRGERNYTQAWIKRLRD